MEIFDEQEDRGHIKFFESSLIVIQATAHWSKKSSNLINPQKLPQTWASRKHSALMYHN